MDGINYPLAGMNDYQRLEAYGWTKFHSSRHYDYYHKTDNRGNGWVALVPISIYFSIVFEKNGKRFSPKTRRSQL
jgi:hypothetical protein